MWLSPAHARHLGYLYHASSLRQSLSDYAEAQDLDLAELLAWERELDELGVAIPPRHRPVRFVAVEVER